MAGLDRESRARGRRPHAPPGRRSRIDGRDADGVLMEAPRVRRRPPPGTDRAGQRLATFVAAGLAFLSVAGVISAATVYTSFWQTIGALYLPLTLLLLSLVLFLFGRMTSPSGRDQRTWSVVRLGREDLLDVHVAPDPSSDTLYRYWPTARGLRSVGQSRRSGPNRWMPIAAPPGKGWVDAAHLTEEVDVQTFVEDEAPIRVLGQFVTALRGSGDLARVVSVDGLLVALTGGAIVVSVDDVASAIAGRPTIDLNGSGDLDLREHVLVPFLTAYAGTRGVTAEAAHSSTALLPTACENYRYLVLHNDATGRPWLVFFEYRKGRPWVAGIGIDS